MTLSFYMSVSSKAGGIRRGSKGVNLAIASEALFAALNPSRRELIDKALGVALASFKRYAGETFVNQRATGDKNRFRTRYTESEYQAGAALLRQLFTGEQSDNSAMEVATLNESVRQRVYMWFALICTQEGIYGTPGQAASWYERTCTTNYVRNKVKFNPYPNR